MTKILGCLRDEQGIETLEWIAVGAQPGLQSAVNTIVGKLNT